MRGVLTLGFAACSAALALPLLLPTYLPFVDWPQHLAQLTVWSHLDDPAWGLQGRYEVNLATPYALGYLLARAAGLVLGVEAGLKFVLWLALAALPLSTLAVLRAYGRPSEIALAAFPVALGWQLFMGFFPFLVALPLVIVGVALARHAASGRALFVGLLAAVALATLAAHAMALFMLFGLALTAAAATRPRGKSVAAVALALAPAGFVFLAWAVRRAHDPAPEPLPYRYGVASGRLRELLAHLFGSGAADARVLAVAAAMFAVAVVAVALCRAERASEDPSPRRALAWPALAATLGYAIAPNQAFDAWGYWQRFAPVALLLGACCLPWPSRRGARYALAGALLAVALFAASSAAAQGIAFSRAAAGMLELARELPRGQRVLWMPCGEDAPVVNVSAVRHFGAYYTALRGGELSYSFARFPHHVVRFRGPPPPEEHSAYDLAIARSGRDCPLAPSGAEPWVRRSGIVVAWPLRWPGQQTLPTGP